MNLQEIKKLEQEEFIKRDSELCLIPSEGFPSEDVLNACSSIYSLKYAEGRVGKRYYCGCTEFDKMEKMCEESILKLFNAENKYNACVQPHSGSQANMIVYGALLQPNDTILSMDTASGSHISHNHCLSFLGKYHNIISYGLDKNGCINYEELRELALKHKPKLIIAGISAYSRQIDFKKIKEIADEVNAYTLADCAHITSLIVSGLHQNPVDYDYTCVTMTTHKMLNGPRGGVVLYKKELEKDITRGLIPFCQGGPLGNIIYSKLTCFNNILNNIEAFNEYSMQILKNSKAMCKTFLENEIPIVSNGTDNHLMLIDLSNNFNISGRKLSLILEQCGIICNCNTVPNDKRSFFETSGIRVGAPFLTARGLKEEDFEHIALHISELINLYKDNNAPDEITLDECKVKLKSCVEYYCKKFPLRNFYPNRYKYLFD